MLSRGYGRSRKTAERVDAEGSAERFGDEPLLIARATGVPVYVGASRYEAGLLAERELPVESKHVHLLDDGFQHRQLARNVDIVVVHAAICASGCCRQDVCVSRCLHCGRADVIVLRQEDKELETSLRAYTRKECLFWRVRRTLSLATLPASEQWPSARSPGPANFSLRLAAAGVEMVERISFRDHHRYTAADIDRLAELGQRHGCDAFVVTGKDEVKLDAAMRLRLNAVAPLRTARLMVEMEDETLSLASCWSCCEYEKISLLSQQNEQLRVLIVRLGAMGDILHALPAVTALRQAHPKWYLGWAVEPRWRALLCGDKAGSHAPGKGERVGSFSAQA